MATEETIMAPLTNICPLGGEYDKYHMIGAFDKRCLHCREEIPDHFFAWRKAPTIYKLGRVKDMDKWLDELGNRAYRVSFP